MSLEKQPKHKVIARQQKQLRKEQNKGYKHVNKTKETIPTTIITYEEPQLLKNRNKRILQVILNKLYNDLQLLKSAVHMEEVRKRLKMEVLCEIEQPIKDLLQSFGTANITNAEVSKAVSILVENKFNYAKTLNKMLDNLRCLTDTERKLLAKVFFTLIECDAEDLK